MKGSFSGLASSALGVLAVVGAAAAARADLMIGVAADNTLVTFDSAAPGTILASRTVVGLRQDELILGVDFRPTDGALFVLGSTNRLYRVDRDTGFASAAAFDAFSPGLDGTDFGMTFEPTGNLLRITSDSGQNLVLDSTTGAVTSTDATLRYAAGEANAGAIAGIVACAARFTFQTGTVVYGIDLARGLLVRIENPLAGTVRIIGPLGLTGLVTDGFAVLDASPSGSTLFAFLDSNDGSVSREFDVNLSTGSAAQIGAPSPLLLRAGAVVPSSPPAPPGTLLVGLVGTADLVRFTTDAPQSGQSVVHVRGLPAGEELVGIAVRPANGILYGITRTALYDVDLQSGMAQRVGPGFAAALPAGVDLACDFDPALDRLRVVGADTVNLKVDPRTGDAVSSDASFSFAPGDPHAAETPTVHGIAFTGRTTPGAPSKAYVLERANAVLARLGNSSDAPDEARTGRLFTIGPVEIDGVGSLPSNLGLVATGTTTAYAALHVGSPIASLFHVDLGSGRATIVGAIGTDKPVRGLTVLPSANPPRMDVTRLSSKLRFRRPIHDSLTLRGDIPIPTGAFEGKSVTVDVDGLAKTFVLNAKGKGKLDDDWVRIGGVASRGIRLRVSLAREDLVSVFADEGMDGTLYARRAPEQVIVSLTVDGHTYRTPVDVYYSAYPGRSGTITTE